MSVSVQSEAGLVSALKERVRSLERDLARQRAGARMPGGWHSPRSVADYLGFSERWVRDHAADGEFGPTIKLPTAPVFSGALGRKVFHGSLRISGAGVNAWLERHSTPEVTA